jgi:O-antigen ligase
MTFSGIMLALSLFFVTLAVRLWRERVEGFPARERLVLTAAAALSTAAIVLTFTRGAWIGWASGVAVLVIRTRAKWAFYLGILAIAAVTLSPMPLFARLISIADLRQASNLDRLRMIQGGVEMIRDFPLFGVGIANVKEVYPLYRAGDAPRFRVPHLHNNVVQIWAERGLFALLAYLWLWGGFILASLRVRERDGPRRLYADAGLALATGLTVAGLFEYNFGESEVLHTTLAMLALTAAGREGVGEAAGPATVAPANAPARPVVA